MINGLRVGFKSAGCICTRRMKPPSSPRRRAVMRTIALSPTHAARFRIASRPFRRPMVARRVGAHGTPTISASPRAVPTWPSGKRSRSKRKSPSPVM